MKPTVPQTEAQMIQALTIMVDTVNELKLKQGHNMTYQEYAQYIKFAMDEEVERMSEFLSCLGLDGQPVEDCSDDRYWTVEPGNFTMPSREELITVLKGRDYSLDLAIISSGSDQDKEILYLALRDLINS